MVSHLFYHITPFSPSHSWKDPWFESFLQVILVFQYSTIYFHACLMQFGWMSRVWWLTIIDYVDFFEILFLLLHSLIPLEPFSISNAPVSLFTHVRLHIYRFPFNTNRQEEWELLHIDFYGVFRVSRNANFSWVLSDFLPARRPILLIVS